MTAQHTLYQWIVDPANSNNVLVKDFVGEWRVLAAVRGWNPEHSKDSARLIAAAPKTAAKRDRLREINAELFGTVEAVIFAFQSIIGQFDKDQLKAWDRARAILAKNKESQ